MQGFTGTGLSACVALKNKEIYFQACTATNTLQHLIDLVNIEARDDFFLHSNSKQHMKEHIYVSEKMLYF